MKASKRVVAGVVASAGMLAATAHGQIVINEVFANPPGNGSNGDDRWEYIELYGPPGMSLSGYMLASVFGGGDSNGNNIPGPKDPAWDDFDEIPEIDEAWSLDGFTIGSNGLFVLYNNNGASSGRPSLLTFAPGTNTATFGAAHCPTTDTFGRIKNDGSATFILVRKRPYHALNGSGLSLYDGATAASIFAGQTSTNFPYPTGNRYAWRKDVNPDVDFNGHIDYNGIGTLVVGGGPAPAETPVNTETVYAPPYITPAAKSLEPYQMVDDIAWSNGGGKEYSRSQEQEITATTGYNPDAISRLAYYGTNPHLGSVYINAQMQPTRMADEEFVYGDIPSVPSLVYDPVNRGGPTDPSGPLYNNAGVLDPNGTHRLNDINLTGFKLTPGAFNDVNSTGSGGINIVQFRFVRGDFNFDGVVDCADKDLIEHSLGASLDAMETKTATNGTPNNPNDDFTYQGWKYQGRSFNRVLAMVRMSLTDGTTGDWNSGVTVTQADIDAFHALFPNPCCPADLDDDGDFTNGLTKDGGVDINDLLAFLGAFEDGNLGADLDDDGDPAVGTPDEGVDINDMLYFLAHFEMGC